MNNLEYKTSHPDWRELSTLEYILTWGYTDNELEDTKQLLYLREKIDNDLKNHLEK